MKNFWSKNSISRNVPEQDIREVYKDMPEDANLNNVMTVETLKPSKYPSVNDWPAIRSHTQYY